MDTGKPTKTLTDYLVVAVSPALIMVMVHSVCFFLVEVFYRGEAGGGVRWVLFWFVLAVVLIARIGIEQGDGWAMGYGLLLAGATWVYLMSVQSNAVLGILLLGIVWFTAHQITCNCTLVDDDVDASGQGLLQTVRKLPRWFQKRHVVEAPTEAKPAPRLKIGQRPASVRISVPPPQKAKPSNAPAPGVWLLYFGLAALPIFGLGQTLLPAGDLAARHRGFVYLFFYLAAALSLLVTTSFLGLRRYLRQRYLEMPGTIALGWLQFGVLGAAVVLSLALLLPRPGAGEAWGVLRYHVDYRLRQASEYAARFNPHGRGSGRAGHPMPPGDQPQNPSAPPGQSSGPDQKGEGHTQAPGDQPPGTASDQGAPGTSGGENSGPHSPDLSPVASALYPWLKLLFYAVTLLGLGWLLYRYRLVVLAALRGMLNALRNFFALLRGLFQTNAAAPPAAGPRREVPSFRTFKNPFLTGGDRIWPPEELIAYSYDALKSWALASETAADSPQTPRELCRELGTEIPAAAEALEHLAFLYGHVAYGASVPAGFNREHLRVVWDYMSVPRPQSPAGAAPEARPAVTA